MHAVGAKGTVPLGWVLYLPEEWCSDEQRRRKAKIPEEVIFKTEPQLGVDLALRAAGWKIERALGDCAYGNNTELRDRLDEGGVQYLLSVSPETMVFSQETEFTVPAAPAAKRDGRRPNIPVLQSRRQESDGGLRCLERHLAGHYHELLLRPPATRHNSPLIYGAAPMWSVMAS